MVSLEDSDDSELESFATRLLRAGLLVDTMYTPILCLFGLLGNSLSLAVFGLDSNYRRQSASYYLSALAISDTGFLLNLFAVWWENMYGGVITSKIMCPLVMYLGQVACFISVYLIVAFSVERYIAIHFPLSRASICTKSNAKKRIIGIVATALVLFSYAWIIAQVIEIKSAHMTSNLKENGTNNTFPLNETDIDPDYVSALARQSSHLPFEHKLKKQSYGLSKINSREKMEDDYHFLEKHFQEIEAESLSSSNITQNRPKNRNFATSEPLKMKINKIDTSHESPTFDENEELESRPKSVLFSSEKKITAKLSNVVQTLFDVNAGLLDPANNFSDNPVTRNFDASADSKDDGSFHYCSVPEKFYTISEIANYLDMVITLVIPFLLITFVNVKIAISLWKLRDERAKILAENAVSSSSTEAKGKQLKRLPVKKQASNVSLLPVDKTRNGESNSSSIESVNQNNEVLQAQQLQIETDKAIDATKCKKWKVLGRVHRTTVLKQSRQSIAKNTAEVRVTKLLLLVSTVFLVLNLPLHVIRCAQFMQSLTGTKQEKEMLLFLQPWANLLFNTNFAVNFFLYCASGSHFRQSLKKQTAKLLHTLQQKQQCLVCTTQVSNHRQDTRKKGEYKQTHNASRQTSARSSVCTTTFTKERTKSERMQLNEKNIANKIEDDTV